MYICAICIDCITPEVTVGSNLFAYVSAWLV